MDELLRWSQREFSFLPWRQRRTLYRTLVSEVMLQQTTVATVLGHFDRFIQEFPTLKSLAQAPQSQVEVAWKGLGYYRRARNLHRAAVYLINHHGGEFPLELQALKNIPGIGPYTANALLAIGANKKALAVDANIKRALGRFFLAPAQGLEETYLRYIHPLRTHRRLNEALMDVGRVFCRARQAHCPLCPLKAHCQAYRRGEIAGLLQKERKKKTPTYRLDLVRLFVQDHLGQIWGQARPPGGWLAGQVELPTLILFSEDPNMNQYPRAWPGEDFTHDFQIKTVITKYKITNHVTVMGEGEFQKKFCGRFILKKYAKGFKNFSTTTLKIIESIHKGRSLRKCF